MTNSPEFDYAILHIGGVGDLVLLSDMVAQLKSKTAIRLALLCRAGPGSVTKLFPVQPDKVFEIGLNPYIHNEITDDLIAELLLVKSRLAGVRVRTLFCADLASTWFAGFLAALLQPERALAAGRLPIPAAFLQRILKRLNLTQFDLTSIDLPSEIHELARYDLLLTQVGLKTGPRQNWVVPAESARASKRWLSKAGLSENKYIVAAPFGSGSRDIKYWPPKRFASTLTLAINRYKLDLLIVGDQSRKEDIELLVKNLATTASKVVIFIGEPDEMQLLAGLIASADVYIGMDTGPSHLAQAYGVPSAILFGAGCGTAYAPWGRGSVGIMQPLPCAGCFWDCAMGSPLCLERVSTDNFVTVVDSVVLRSNSPKIQFLSILPEPLLGIVSRVSSKYRKMQSISQGRLETVNSLAGLIDGAEEFERTLRQFGEATEQLRRSREKLRETVQELRQTRGWLRGVALVLVSLLFALSSWAFLAVMNSHGG